MATPSYTQVGKPIRVTTGAGADALLLERMVVDEAVSKPFTIELEMLSSDPGIDPKKILRKPVTIEVDLVGGGIRYFNGIARRFVQYGRSQGLVSYRAEVVPWLWLLSLSSDCRIFQAKSVTDIVKVLLDELGVKDYRFSVSPDPPPRDYCVQYRETHLDFVSRLLEEEGIFYFFEHTKDKHTLVFANAPSAVKPGPVAKLPMNLATSANAAPDSILELEVASALSSGKATLADYDDTQTKQFSSSIPASADAFTAATHEVRDYPGKFAAVDEGDRIARLRMEELEALALVVKGRSNCRGLGSGQKLTVSGYYRADANIAYHLLSLHHEGKVGEYRSAGAAFAFETSFTGIPQTVPFRPPRITPKSLVNGSQTAVVVGPAGEEIFTDKYGRVKVQFFWDKVGKLDDKSSCWIRVSSTWAGKQWGFIQIPRIGQEVVVDFLEGDPDRPIITGRVYNSELMPPYALPANGTQSGLKTRSSKSGGVDNFNELRFEDKKGSEEVYFHAEKDLNTVVENDESHKVGHNRVTEIKNDETKTVQEGNELTAISKGNQTLTVDKGTQTITVEGDRTITIKTGADSLTVKTGDLKTEVSTGKHVTLVKTGDMTTEVSTGKHVTTVKTGDMTTEVSLGNHATTVKVGNMTVKLNVGGITHEAMQSIELKVGPSSIKLAPDGITIKGAQVNIEGQGMAQIKAPMTTVKGDGMLTLKGGITMIN